MEKALLPRLMTSAHSCLGSHAGSPSSTSASASCPNSCSLGMAAGDTREVQLNLMLMVDQLHRCVIQLKTDMLHTLVLDCCWTSGKQV
jgi:hypothetical protein